MPRPDKSRLEMTEKDERYKGIMRLPHFLRKFAMTEGGRKYEKKYKGWIPACAGMTDRSVNN